MSSRVPHGRSRLCPLRQQGAGAWKRGLSMVDVWDPGCGSLRHDSFFPATDTVHSASDPSPSKTDDSSPQSACRQPTHPWNSRTRNWGNCSNPTRQANRSGGYRASLCQNSAESLCEGTTRGHETAPRGKEVQSHQNVSAVKKGCGRGT